MFTKLILIISDLKFSLYLLFLLLTGWFITGYNSIKSVQYESIKEISIKYNIDEAHMIILDTGYIRRIKKLVLDSTDRNNLVQPLRAHYYIDNELKSSLINCYAPGKGISKLDWASDNRFSVFPPKSHYSYKYNLDLIQFSDLLHLQKPKQSIVIFICWYNILKNKSIELIDLVLLNLKKENINYELYLVNQDILYVDVD
ncbi:MAG: hypothetical protein IPO86_06805 [Saprospiraceae bacterium]|nr:hypothetical protein [Saprospiraceae bacterium]MBK9727812.1 hypothetical protein [Saprospiraceae bacterium]